MNRRGRGAAVRRAERGSAAIEAVIGITAFVALGSMIIAGGRIAITQQAVEAAAAEAARSASISRDAGTAAVVARDRGLASLENQEVPCLPVPTVVVEVPVVPLGVSANARATVTCRVDLSDVAIPNFPGSMTIERTMESPIDAYRQR
ncbi:TadE/TadG family type IV pilus assembly protein [Myceligenerans crystallogenes]|uniref:Pilus assembly protein n=1 Tax=Myceligenerans crystallogenes TaxID=316335 RepID=A0ABN2N4A7_9MICO